MYLTYLEDLKETREIVSSFLFYLDKQIFKITKNISFKFRFLRILGVLCRDMLVLGESAPGRESLFCPSSASPCTGGASHTHLSYPFSLHIWIYPLLSVNNDSTATPWDWGGHGRGKVHHQREIQPKGLCSSWVWAYVVGAGSPGVPRAWLEGEG